jgi:hypothetical protein
LAQLGGLISKGQQQGKADEMTIHRIFLSDDKGCPLNLDKNAGAAETQASAIQPPVTIASRPFDLA